LLEDSVLFEKVNKLRDNLIKTCERNDNGIYHITLAYKCNCTDMEIDYAIMNEVEILNMLLQDQSVTLQKPLVTYFEDMTKFVPLKEFLNIF
jgi:hypothetical protein